VAFAETANLAVKLTLGGNFTSQLKKATSDLKGFNKDASRGYKAGVQIGTGIKRGAAIAAAGVGVLVSQIGFGLDQLVELESLTAQTNAVIKSTGGVAGQTAESVRTLAENYESLNAQVDDKAIQNAENVLLTFTRVGKNAFQPALEAALNMSTALHSDLQPTILAVGKALQDPAKGFTALKRAGVNFNVEQQKTLKGTDGLTKEEAKHYIQLQKSDQAAAKRYIATLRANKLATSQRIILAELQKEFGGSFLAGGQTTAGKVAKFGDAIEDLQKSLATALLPTVGNVADALNTLLRDPEVIRGTEDLGRQIGNLFSKDNIKNGIDALRSGFGLLKDVAGTIASVVGTAVGAFRSLPPDIQKLLVGGFVVNKVTGGLVTNILGGIVEEVGKAFGIGGIKAPLVNVQGGVVNVGGGGIPGVGGAGAGVGGSIAGDIVAAFGTIGLGTTLGLVIAPASIAAIGLAITQASDPTGSRNHQGLVGTATSRGVPIGNVPGIAPGARTPAFVNRFDNWVATQKQSATDLAEAASQLRNATRTGGDAAIISHNIAAAVKDGDASVVRAVHAIPSPKIDIKTGSVSTTTNVKVNVTAGGIHRTVTYQLRHGRSSGSRNGLGSGVGGSIPGGL